MAKKAPATTELTPEELAQSDVAALTGTAVEPEQQAQTSTDASTQVAIEPPKTIPGLGVIRNESGEDVVFVRAKELSNILYGARRGLTANMKGHGGTTIFARLLGWEGDFVAAVDKITAFEEKYRA